MIFFLSPCVLWISTCISFLSADSIISVSAPLNSTVLLPCNFTHDTSLRPHVEWSIDSEAVFERLGERIYQAEGYKDRVDVPEDELLKGNCSLVLKNFRATDAGTYRSHVTVKDEMGTVKLSFFQNVDLRIDETPMPDTETSDKSPSTTNDSGINSDNKMIIISSVVPVVVIALSIPTAVVLYRRNNTEEPSNKNAQRCSIDDEHQDDDVDP